MTRRRRSVLLVSLLCVVAIVAPPGAAADEHGAGRLGPGLRAAAAGKAPDRAVMTRLRDGVREIAVVVELAEGPGASVRGRLRSAGLDLRGTWRHSVEGYVRPRDLLRLAAVPGVAAVRAIRRPMPAAFVGPAPALHGATAWHDAGYTGTGVKVGILDGGFEGFAARLGVELPAQVKALCFADLGVSSPNLADCVTAGETHGTAVAESIIDMAPGAELFVSNAMSPADMAAAVTWMTSNGVGVINFSMGSFEGMGDGTSPYPDSTYALVDSAVAGGALFVASAGNMGEAAWSGPPTDADDDGWVEFTAGDPDNAVALEAGETIAVALRWPSAAADYDIYLFDGDSIVASSEDTQAATGDPSELFEFEAPAGRTYSVSIRHDGGPDASLLKLLMHGSGAATLQHHVTAGSLTSPADSRNPGLLAVGAVYYATPDVIEPWSSQGPTLDGRVKPDLVAADCAATTVEAEFCGTSQAAPFVTGAAALLVEADPSLTPGGLAALLRQRAVPLGSPVPNNAFGSGRLALGPTPVGAPAAAAFLAPPASGTAAAPGSGTPAAPLLGQPTVAIVDAGGRVAISGPGATLPVTLSLEANPGGATLACDGGTTQLAAAGIAAFSGCALDLAGSGYTIRADVPGLVSATSAPFAVGAPGEPPQLSFVATPTTVSLGAAVGGTITTAIPAAASGTAVLERSPDGRLWQRVQDVVLDATGAGTHSSVPVVHGRYRARLVLPDGSVAVSAAVAVRVNATARLASSIPSGRTIRRTTRITMTETIRPAGTSAGVAVARGRARFDLFLQVGTKWVRKRTIYAWADPATGRARITTTLATAGRWWIRSRAEATATNGASAWTAGVRYRVG